MAGQLAWHPLGLILNNGRSLKDQRPRGSHVVEWRMGVSIIKCNAKASLGKQSKVKLVCKRNVFL